MLEQRFITKSKIDKGRNFKRDPRFFVLTTRHFWLVGPSSVVTKQSIDLFCNN